MSTSNSESEFEPDPNTGTSEIISTQSQSSMPANLDWQRGQTFAPPKEKKWKEKAIQSFEMIVYLRAELDYYIKGLAKRGVHTSEGLEWYCSLGRMSDARRVLVSALMQKLTNEFKVLESAMKTGKAKLSENP